MSTILRDLAVRAAHARYSRSCEIIGASESSGATVEMVGKWRAGERWKLESGEKEVEATTKDKFYQVKVNGKAQVWGKGEK